MWILCGVLWVVVSFEAISKLGVKGERDERGGGPWVGDGEWGVKDIPNNILRTSRSSRIVVPRHISTSSSTSGINLAFQGGRFEGYGVEIGGSAADVAYRDSFVSFRLNCEAVEREGTNRRRRGRGKDLRDAKMRRSVCRSR
jgi:hypothetical protein